VMTRAESVVTKRRKMSNQAREGDVEGDVDRSSSYRMNSPTAVENRWRPAAGTSS
jgi:hypothetical protein